MGERDKIRFFEKIAKMELMGVPRSQICEAVNLSEGRLSQIINSEPAYQRVAQQLSIEEFDKLDTLNSGWDMVESLSVAQIVQSLQLSHDPDFALRAATLANKAQRRGAYNKPIGANGVGGQTVRLSLNANFVEKLNQVTNVQINSQDSQEPSEDKDTPKPNRFGFNFATKPVPLEELPAEQPNLGLLGIKKKDTNFLNPSEVHKLLDPSESNKQSFEQALGDFAIVDAAPA